MRAQKRVYIYIYIYIYICKQKNRWVIRKICWTRNILQVIISYTSREEGYTIEIALDETRFLLFLCFFKRPSKEFLLRHNAPLEEKFISLVYRLNARRRCISVRLWAQNGIYIHAQRHARSRHPYLIPYYPSWKEQKEKREREREREKKERMWDPVRGRFTCSRLESVWHDH